MGNARGRHFILLIAICLAVSGGPRPRLVSDAGAYSLDPTNASSDRLEERVGGFRDWACYFADACPAMILIWEGSFTWGLLGLLAS